MPPEFIIDASVIVKWLNEEREPHLEQARNILGGAAAGHIALATSDLAVHEVFNALIMGKRVRGAALAEALEGFFILPLTIVATSDRVASRAAEIAITLAITFYDAAYLALAFERGATLITANPKHQRPIPGVAVIPLGEWQPD